MMNETIRQASERELFTRRSEQVPGAATQGNLSNSTAPLIADVESLTQQAAVLQKILEDLGMRLTPVLTPRDPEVNEICTKEETIRGSCSLSCQLRNVSIALLDCKTSALFLLRNLEI